YVTVEDLNLIKCPALDSVYVYVNSFNPVINVLGDVCSGQVTLSVEPAGAFYSYLWTGPSSGGQQLVIGSAQSGTYSVQVRDQNSGCLKTSAPIDVTVVDPFTVSLSSTLACDNGDPFTITAAATADVSYSWFLEDALIDGEKSSTLSTDKGGNYSTAVEKQGCVSEAELTVTLLPFTPPDLPNRIAICDDPENPDPSKAEYELKIGSPYIDFQWRKDGTLVSTDPTYLVVENGVYTVDLINEFGCTATDKTDVITQCDPILNAPNAFSPNGNAQNEEFFIYTTFITDEFDIKLYNRWGELVYQSSDKNFRWNGRYNNVGDLLPGGTYAYIIKFVSKYEVEKGTQETRGGVLLLR
ncbi:MAG: gliding motility-associated C-terminal domain-containing protein, partial [Cyclobacteriaceae bacterium]|nr:gliding motility-associated C-terminal domain-containing protein [Cyclobacteriaceae bacterium]